MKLYSYSGEVLNFVEVKWLKIKYTAIVIVIGFIIFLVAVIKTQSLDPLKFRSTNIVIVENAFLEQQISLMAFRLNGLEQQLITLNEHSNALYNELDNGPVVHDSALYFSNGAIGSFLNRLRTAPIKEFPNYTNDIVKSNIIIVKK